jgi:hypothetical protein
VTVPDNGTYRDFGWDCPHCAHHEDADSLGHADLGYSHHLWTVHAFRRAEQPIPLEDVIPMTPDQVAWVRRSRGDKRR